MNKSMLCVVSLLLFFCASVAHADEFVGTGSRWPVSQPKAIAGHPDLDYIFVGDGDTLNVFNKSDLARVAHLRISSISEGIRALLYSHDRQALYAACGYSGVRIFDVQNPENPIESASYTTSTENAGNDRVNAFDIALFDRYLFVADHNYGLRILDMSVTESPIDKGGKNTIDFTDTLSPLKVDVYSTGPDSDINAIVILNSYHGPVIARFPIENISNTPVFSQPTGDGLPSLLGTGTLRVDGQMAYCIDSLVSDLIIYNVLHTNPQAPELIFSQSTHPDYDPNGDDITKNTLALYLPRGLDLSGDYAFITTHGYYNGDPDSDGNYFGLNVVNISDPTAPRAISRYPLTGANSVMVMGDTAYITSLRDGLYKVNLAYGTDPEVLITDPPGLTPSETMINAHDITIQKDMGIAFVADDIDGPSGGLTLIRLKPDTSDDDDETVITRYASPAFPIHERFLSTPGTAKATCIDELNYFAYVADGPAGIQVLRLRESGPANPVLIPGSTVPPPAGSDVIDVETVGNLLMAITTDPDEELWIVDVSADTTLDDPATFIPQAIDLTGATATAKSVTPYTLGSAIYAMVPRGDSGLTIIHINPDEEHPDTWVIPPAADQIYQIDSSDARKVYARSSQTGAYALLADGIGGVKIIKLFQDDAPIEMAPEIVATIDTSSYGRAIDVSVFADSKSSHLYILTDNPDKAVLLYQITDIEHPEFFGYVSSYGRGSAILASEITMASDTTITGQINIRGVFVADGPGGISFRQVTDDDSRLADRVWPDDDSSFCFVSTPFSSMGNTGLFPVFVFLAACLGVVLVCTMILHRRSGK